MSTKTPEELAYQREANKRHRQKLKELGLVERTYVVPADKADTVRQLCNELKAKHLASLKVEPAPQPPTETYDWL